MFVANTEQEPGSIQRDVVIASLVVGSQWATEPLHVVEGFRERHEDQPSRDRQTASCVEMDRAVQDVLRAVRAKSGGDPTRGRTDRPEEQPTELQTLLRTANTAR